MSQLLEVQLRTEDGELIFFNSIEAAMERARVDRSIWKISWTDSITHERIRLVRRQFYSGEDFWVYEPVLDPVLISRLVGDER